MSLPRKALEIAETALRECEGVTVSDLMRPRDSIPHAKQRVMYSLRASNPKFYTYPRIAGYFHCDKTNVIHGIRSFMKREGITDFGPITNPMWKK